jgi:hypothetical protein
VSIKKSEVYYEKTVGNKHCYKYQIPGQDVIIVTDIDEKVAWNKFINEYERCKTSIEESVLPISDVSVAYELLKEVLQFANGSQMSLPLERIEKFVSEYER